jgi:branched-chain amino acid transport system permease protein
MDILAQQLINGLVLGAMYALVALGYTMVYGVLNLINFAHGDVLMIGAMVGWSLLQVIQYLSPELPGYLALMLAIAGALSVWHIVVCVMRHGLRR